MYTFQSKIRYSEVDKNGFLPVSSIINYFQDCSTLQSESLLIGPQYLKNQNRSWILNGWQLLIHRLPKLSEEIIIGTWAYGFKGFYGYRNFILKDHNDKLLAVANSIWVFIDNDTGHPTRVPIDYACIYELEPPYPMEYGDRKIEIPTEGFMYHPEINVTRSFIDSYNHVNNGKYIRMAEDYLPENFQVNQMRAEYKYSALLGDNIIPKVSNTNNKYIISLSNSSEKEYAIIEFDGQNI